MDELRQHLIIFQLPWMSSYSTIGTSQSSTITTSDSGSSITSSNSGSSIGWGNTGNSSDDSGSKTVSSNCWGSSYGWANGNSWSSSYCDSWLSADLSWYIATLLGSELSALLDWYGLASFVWNRLTFLTW